MKIYKRPAILPTIAIALILFTLTPAQAQIDILPAHTSQSGESSINDDLNTHPPLNITPDKSALIRLKEDAATILIGNPTHVSILAENARTLVVIPQEAGASSFTVLNKDGQIIMQRHVIIAAPANNYIRIRRSCAGSKSDDCQQTSVFYCPDMCHSVKIGRTEQTAPPANTAPEHGTVDEARAAAYETEPTAD